MLSIYYIPIFSLPCITYYYFTPILVRKKNVVLLLLYKNPLFYRGLRCNKKSTKLDQKATKKRAIYLFVWYFVANKYVNNIKTYISVCNKKRDFCCFLLQTDM